MYNEISIRFLSKRNNIVVVRNMVGAMIVENNPTITFLNELKTVISEGITNAIVHGYDNVQEEYINLNIVIDDEIVAIDIIDYGKGIEDINLALEPLYSSKSDEERSGLGFTIMKIFSDNFYVESRLGEGTKVHIEKKW